jgi:hypothetical protein
VKKKTVFVFMVVMMLVLLITVVVAAAPPERNTVYWWWGAEAGSSQIVRTDGGIHGNYIASMSNEVADAKGLAVTLWLVVFNVPSECATYPEPCTDVDLFDEDVMPDVLYGSGNVVGESENASFGFSLNAGDNSGSIAALFGMPLDNGEGFGLRYPHGAEIHYVARTHGPMVPSEMPAQIQTYGGGCIDFAPFGYPVPANPLDLYLGVGQCQDVQFAINSP